MAQSLALVLVHIIFSTKNRSPFLQSTEVRSQAHAYLTGTLRALDCAPLEVGGVADHVHILCGLSRKISLAELVKNLKTGSTICVGLIQANLTPLQGEPLNGMLPRVETRIQPWAESCSPSGQ